ncbi:MAG: hypothetical protein ACKVT1_09390 [Dehalococcoidia bacterium]
MAKTLSPARRFIRPAVTDTWATIAARELSGLPAEEALASLRGWNPHLALRRGSGLLLVSDIVFTEA